MMMHVLRKMAVYVRWMYAKNGVNQPVINFNATMDYAVTLHRVVSSHSIHAKIQMLPGVVMVCVTYGAIKAMHCFNVIQLNAVTQLHVDGMNQKIVL